MDGLIGRIDVEPEAPSVGQSVAVEVFDATGASYATVTPDPDTIVRINGILGAMQYLQFSQPGEHVVSVTVMRRGDRGWVSGEARRELIVVPPSAGSGALAARSEAPAGSSLPLLRATELRVAPFGMTFSLDFAAPIDLRDPPPPRRADRDDALVAERAGRRRTSAGAPSTEYAWDFGDGDVVRSLSPSVQHDFESRLDPLRPQQNFHVVATVSQEGRQVAEVKRTLSIVHPYAICRRLGTIVAKTVGEAAARVVPGGFEAEFAIVNVEAEALVFSSTRVRPVHADARRSFVHGIDVLPVPLEVGPSETKVVTVTVTGGRVPRDASCFVLHLFGDDVVVDGERLRLRAEVAFSLPLDGLLGREDGSRKPASAAPTAVRVVAAMSSTDFLRARPSDVASVAGFGREGSDAFPGQDEAARSVLESRSRPTEEGAECVPGTGPSGDGLHCMYTLDQKTANVPARFVNAQKGDLLLTAGGDGITGSLLRQITPPQYYSHDGIVTQDVAWGHDGAVHEQEITHATACVERLVDERFWIGRILGRPFPTDGVREDVLKYMWPGVVTQSVGRAIHGERMHDPETGACYTVGGFRPVTKVMDVGGAWEIVPPLVVKPDPASETPAIRARLHDLADAARSEAGRGHYRLYGFSNPAELDEPAPSEAGWAAGTRGWVCSSFVWDLARRMGVHLEGDLEPGDVAGGAVVDEGSADGLYAYNEEERAAAATFVADYIKRRVAGVAGSFSTHPAVVAAATVVANQVTNTFTRDDASNGGAREEAWRTPGPGLAVSPANLLFWDGPDGGGLYGYAAPAILDDERTLTRAIYRWRAIEGRGDLGGVVRFGGEGVPDAVVQAVGGSRRTTTDGEGRYAFDDLPIGDYEVSATKVIEGVPCRADALAVVVVSNNRHDLDLQPLGRLLSLSGRVRVGTSGSKGDTRDLPEEAVAVLGPFRPHHEARYVLSFEASTRVELVVKATWLTDTAIEVDLGFDWTRAGAGESIAAWKSIHVPAGSTRSISGWGARHESGDELRIDLELFNGPS